MRTIEFSPCLTFCPVNARGIPPIPSLHGVILSLTLPPPHDVIFAPILPHLQREYSPTMTSAHRGGIPISYPSFMMSARARERGYGRWPT